MRTLLICGASAALALAMHELVSSCSYEASYHQEVRAARHGIDEAMQPAEAIALQAKEAFIEVYQLALDPPAPDYGAATSAPMVPRLRATHVASDRPP